jgi:hypothetical protein
MEMQHPGCLPDEYDWTVAPLAGLAGLARTD